VSRPSFLGEPLAVELEAHEAAGFELAPGEVSGQSVAHQGSFLSSPIVTPLSLTLASSSGGLRMSGQERVEGFGGGRASWDRRT